MFRPMRRVKNQLPPEAARQLLCTQRRGILSVNGEDGYPYGLPVNFLYVPEEDKIFFHGAKAGHKADALKKSDRVCFTVVGEPEPSEEAWAPYISSAVAFGQCRLVASREETREKVLALALKYYPNRQTAEAALEKSLAAVQLYEITIEHLTGKRIQEK